jgi:hypothetical protein
MNRFLGLAVVLALGAPAFGQEAPAPAPVPTPAWKLFQEFGFALGSYSGTADSSGRIGGVVSRWTIEMNGNFLVHRVNAIFPAQEGKPEEAIELLGYYNYDRDARKYSASYFFSTGLVGLFDVEFPSEGTLRLVSSRLANSDAGARARMVLAPRPDGAQELTLEMAGPGKEFANYFTCHLKKK